MLYISEKTSNAPEQFCSEVQKQIYETLALLRIPFDRVDNDPAISMSDCHEIEKVLDVHIVKTFLLCNRQQNRFYLFVTPGEKPFITKDFSKALGISRVSFAPEALLKELLDSPVGGTSILSTVYDKEQVVKVIIDNEILNSPYLGCNDATTTTYLKLPMNRILEDYLRQTNHLPIFVNL